MHTADSLAAICGGRVEGCGSVQVDGLAPLQRAEHRHISFIDHQKWLADAKRSNAAVIMISSDLQFEPDLAGRCLLIHPQPRRAVLKIRQLFQSALQTQRPFSIHPTALIHPSALLGADVSVGAYCVVGAATKIENGAFVGPNCTISENVLIGESTRIEANVVLHNGCKIGRGCIVNAGTVIGADGFSFDRFEDGWERLPGLGTVIIGDFVEVGSNCTIDRGALGDTVIKNGVKIDNLVQIAHDVQIGQRVIIAACSGVAGGTTIGSDTKISGMVGIAGNLSIIHGTQIGGGTIVTKSITKSGGYVGVVPFAEYSVWRENFSIIRRLGSLRDRIIRLEEARDD